MGYMVSVVTVCFNAERELERTIKSVLSQSFRNFEYVLKDGDSSDSTNQIIQRYKKEFKDRQISMQHIISKDMGIYDAMNQAVSYCTGEWVIFMNAGDGFYDSQVLSDVFNKCCWDAVDVIYGHTLMKISSKYAIIINHDAEHLEREWSMNHQSIFERKRVLKNYPFEKDYQIVSDYDHLLRIYKTCVFSKCNVIISVMNREGVSNKRIVIRNKENMLLCQKYGIKMKRKSVLGSYIKECIRKAFPALEGFFYAKNSMKRTLCYIEKN